MDFEHDAALELKAQKEKIDKLEAENSRLREVVKDNGLEDEIDDIDCRSIEEKICVDGIRYIASLVESHDQTKDDIINFNTLYNILRSIKGKKGTDKKKPKGEVGDLLKILEGSKK